MTKPTEETKQSATKQSATLSAMLSATQARALLLVALEAARALEGPDAARRRVRAVLDEGRDLDAGPKRAWADMVSSDEGEQ
jgi:hypothetical protein